MDIRREIANKRAARIKEEGYGLSIEIPTKRKFPIVDFFVEPFIICEVKRASPSKGKFAKELNAVRQATHYQKSGIKHISVLTEEDRFSGSLKDLMDIKSSCPGIAVLRKDFLLDLEDIKTSFLCGADAFLLIASLLNKELLESMYTYGEELGMTPLVEVHDFADVQKVRDLKPKLTGINSRNLKTFKIDPLRPLKIRSYIDWPTHVIYESGIKSVEDGIFARDNGFSGILVGEWVVKNESLAGDLARIYAQGRSYSPWQKLFTKYSDKRPFIKVCGITNREDALLASELGADLLGFILAPSPRRVEEDFIKSLKDISDPLKVGVVVLKPGEGLPKSVKNLVNKGYLDFIQYHGDESPRQCAAGAVPYFKALRIRNLNSMENMGTYSKADLLDSYSKSVNGGTGKRISKNIIKEAAKSPNLWLAGGLNPENITEIIKKYSPGLIDVSSGIESYPGKKDEVKMRKYFRELK